MDERILRARWKRESDQPRTCDCGQHFCQGETVFLYPVYDEDAMEFMGFNQRLMFCMTCHFHIINDVMEAMGR